jgi:hypothetical protein
MVLMGNYVKSNKSVVFNTLNTYRSKYKYGEF